MWTFFDGTDEMLLKRFEALPFSNKVAFTERPYSQYPSSFCIRGYENGLGQLMEFENGFGMKKIDQFDYVNWFNTGKKDS